MSFVRQHKGAVLWSMALHMAVAAALLIGFKVPLAPAVAVSAAPIQGVIVDQSVLTREAERREQVAREERERVQRAERQRREAAEEERRAEQRQQREREEAARLERERVAAEERQREQAAREQRERVAAEKREREEAAKREREAAVARRQQQQAEAELQAALAAEEERRAAEQAGLRDQYQLMIQDKIVRNWIKPLSARVGVDCLVSVVQIPSGDVIDVRVGSCNGDSAVVQSIEAAVRRASPLPKPPHPSLFERNINLRFRPDE